MLILEPVCTGFLQEHVKAVDIMASERLEQRETSFVKKEKRSHGYGQITIILLKKRYFRRKDVSGSGKL